MESRNKIPRCDQSKEGASSTASVSGTGAGTSQPRKPILPVELLEIISRKLETKDLLTCRQVDKNWKREAERLLEKRKPSPEIPWTPGENKVQFEDQAKWLSEHVKSAAWFKNTEDIQKFLEVMKHFSGNPFPTRTVVFCLSTQNLWPTEEGQSAFKAALAELVSKFGREILYCYVATERFQRQTGFQVEYRVNVWKSIMLLPNLTFLSMFDPGYFFMNGESIPLQQFAHKNPTSFGKLENLQIFGMGSMQFFKNIFLSTGLARKIQVLHLNAESGYFSLCLGPGHLQNLKKLFLHDLDDIYGLVNITPGKSIFGEVEQLHIFLRHHSTEKTPMSILQALAVADSVSSRTLKKLSIHMRSANSSQKVESGAICFHIMERVLEQSLRARSLSYPELKELSISYSILERNPVIMELFGKRFPHWETLELENICQSKEWSERENSDDSDRNLFFVEICQKLWNEVPPSVGTITADGTGLKAVKPLIYK